MSSPMVFVVLEHAVITKALSRMNARSSALAVPPMTYTDNLRRPDEAVSKAAPCRG